MKAKDVVKLFNLNRTAFGTVRDYYAGRMSNGDSRIKRLKQDFVEIEPDDIVCVVVLKQKVGRKNA